MANPNTFRCSLPFANPKNINKLAVLDLIRFSQGGISRAEIARRLNLSRSAVTSLVNAFLESGIVKEAESGSTSIGRRPILLEINPERGFVIGIDLSASHITLVIADFSSRVLDEMEVRMEFEQGPTVCLRKLDDHVLTLLKKTGISREEVSAIGIGFPGPVMFETGTVGSPLSMPGWGGYPIRSELESHWSRPISLNSGAELGALGEWAYGAGRGELHLAYIRVGAGIGAGLLIDGRIYQGASGCAGEIGHITIDEHGPICSCGNHGCLEAMASGKAIAQQAREALRSGRWTHLLGISPLREITAQDVAVAARHGDLGAQKIIGKAGYKLGIAIAELINIFNPGLVIVGGEVAQVGDLLLEPIRQMVSQRSLRPASLAVRITTPVLGNRSTSIGAVVQALTIALYQIAVKDR